MGHLDAGSKSLSFIGFDKIAQRFGELCPRQEALIGKSGEKDDRDIQLLPQMDGCLYPVHSSEQFDIHQNQIRFLLSGQLYRFLA